MTNTNLIERLRDRADGDQLDHVVMLEAAALIEEQEAVIAGQRRLLLTLIGLYPEIKWWLEVASDECNQKMFNDLDRLETELSLLISAAKTHLEE